jgi:hypothetical protein
LYCVRTNEATFGSPCFSLRTQTDSTDKACFKYWESIQPSSEWWLWGRLGTGASFFYWKTSSETGKLHSRELSKKCKTQRMPICSRKNVNLCTRNASLDSVLHRPWCVLIIHCNNQLRKELLKEIWFIIGRLLEIHDVKRECIF